jgi:hypothetical protein
VPQLTAFPKNLDTHKFSFLIYFVASGNSSCEQKDIATTIATCRRCMVSAKYANPTSTLTIVNVPMRARLKTMPRDLSVGNMSRPYASDVYPLKDK